MEQLCWSLEEIILARQGYLADGLPTDYRFFLIFPKRAPLISLEVYGKKEVLLHFVLLCAKNP